MSKFRASLLLLSACFAVAACSDDDPSGPAPRIPVSIALATDSLGMYPGESLDLEPMLLDNAGQVVEEADITWTISDSAVVSVDAGGILTAREHGVATLTGAVGEDEDTVVVRVTRFVQINGDYPFVLCARDVQGRGWCLGVDMTIPRDSPVVSDDAIHPLHTDLAFSDLTIGRFHACGIAAGETYCWGENISGQLGIGDAGEAREPQPVTGGHEFVRVVAGYERTCALDVAGAAWCWGRNDDGQLGDGGGAMQEFAPVPVAGGHTWRTIDAGIADGTCGIADDGLTYCWGGFFGSEPTLVADFSGHEIELLATDGVQVCGAHDAEMVCRSDPPEPWPELGSAIFPDAVVDLAVSFSFACAVLDSGAMECWGANDDGVLGDGTIGDATEPGPVHSSEHFTAATATEGRACALTANGAIYCWGSGAGGALVPRRVVAPAP